MSLFYIIVTINNVVAFFEWLIIDVNFFLGLFVIVFTSVQVVINVIRDVTVDIK